MDSYPVTREKLAKGGLFAGLPPEIVNKIFEFVTELRTLPSSIFERMKRWTRHYNAFERFPGSFLPFVTFEHQGNPVDRNSIVAGTSNFYGPGFASLPLPIQLNPLDPQLELLNRPYKW